MRRPTLVLYLLSALLFTTCKDDEGKPKIDEPSTTLTYADVANVLTIQERASLKVEEGSQQENDEVAVMFNVAKWLLDQPEVSEVYLEDYAIEVHFSNGIVSDVILEFLDEDGRALARGAGSNLGGQLTAFGSDLHSLKTEQEKIIQNKKVLVFIPFDRQFGYYESMVLDKIKDSPIDLEVDVLLGKDANLKATRSFANYGLIVLNTHGQPDGFEVKTDAFLFSDKRIIDTTVVVEAELVKQQALAAGVTLEQIENGEIKINAKVSMQTNDNKVPLGFTYSYSLQVTDKYIRKLPKLNEAVVFGNYCHSGYTAQGPLTSNIPEAFKSIGAISYYGYALDDKSSTPVDDKESQKMEDALYRRLLFDIDKTGVAHLNADGTEQEDPKSGEFTLKGGKTQITRAKKLTAVKEDRKSGPTVKLKHFIDPEYSYESPCKFFTDDRDDETYNLVCIGTQTWFAQNLRYNAQGSKEPKSASVKEMGRLYDFNTVTNGKGPATSVQGICPDGWRVPNADDWLKLFTTLGAKIDTKYGSGWIVSGQENIDATVQLVTKKHLNTTNPYYTDPKLNNTNFGAVSVGYGQEVGTTFSYKEDYYAYFWSSNSLGKFYDQGSESWKTRNDLHHAVLLDRIPSLSRTNHDPKNISYHYPCRCVKD